MNPGLGSEMGDEVFSISNDFYKLIAIDFIK
jgi:hypothetical protein